MKNIFTALLFLSSLGSSWAYNVLSWDSAKIEFAKPTHLFVVGYSHGQGTQFLASALSQATLYRALYPEHQIIFFTSADSELTSLERLGVKVRISNSADL